jgi:phosphoglycerol transferase
VTKARKEQRFGNSSESFNLKLEVKTIALGVTFTAIAVVFLFRLWGLHPRIPIIYSGDALSTLASLRHMRFGNWYWSTNNLGAPFGQDLHDVPSVADNLHLVIMWVGVKIFRNEFLVFNAYFFGSYFLTSISGYIGSRMLRVQRGPALLIGITYSFLPYHYLQGPNHLYLAAYWAIPLWVAFLLRELMDNSVAPFSDQSLNARTIRSWARKPPTVALTIMAVIATSTGLYYGFFFIVLSFFVIVIRRVGQTTKLQWFTATWAVGVGMVTLAIQYFPVWNYQRIHGSNLSIVHRTVAEVEFYSLKLSNLLLPVAGHRLSFLDHFQQKSNPVYLIGEGSDALGILGSIGFIGLVCIMVFRLVRHRSGLPTALATFTIMSILTCIVGGLAQFIAVFGFTQLRVMSRMSIVIAFPCLVFAVCLITKLSTKFGRSVSLIVLLLMGTVSILDTNPGNQLPSFQSTSIEWEKDSALVKQVETKVGKYAMIFQLPVVPYPESPPVERMTDYEHLKGYLHSPTLKWSYGGVKGRESDWQQSLPTDPAGLLISLKQRGFTAIWIDKRGLTSQMLSQITAHLVQNEAILVMEDTEQLLYKIV